MQPFGQPQGGFGAPQSQAVLFSNEFEDFAIGGGMYSGGTGLVRVWKYVLWDYNGTQPKDSMCGVHMEFQPTDGSNGGKLVQQTFNIGAANEFAPTPDANNLILLKAKPPNTSSNYGHFMDALYKHCGMEKGRLSTQAGIGVMVGTIFTLAQIQLEGFDDLPPAPGAPGGQKKKRPVIVPTRAVFPWDPNYQRQYQMIAAGVPVAAQPTAPAPGMGFAPAPMQQAPVMPQMPQTAFPAAQPQYTPPQYAQALPPMAPAPAPAMPNMAPTPAAQIQGTPNTQQVLAQLLQSHGGKIAMSDLSREGINIMANVDRQIRVAIIQELNNPAQVAAIAAASGWVVAGNDLIG